VTAHRWFAGSFLDYIIAVFLKRSKKENIVYVRITLYNYSACWQLSRSFLAAFRQHAGSSPSHVTAYYRFADSFPAAYWRLSTSMPIAF